MVVREAEDRRKRRIDREAEDPVGLANSRYVKQIVR